MRSVLAGFGIFAAVAAAYPGAAAAQSAPASFNPPINLSATPGTASDLAAITIDGSTIYVAWRQDVAAGQQIRLRRSTTLGAAFSDGPSGRLVAAVDAADTVFSVRIAARGLAVHVLYTSGATLDLARARLVTSADGGTTFAAAITLADEPGTGGAAHGDLVIDGAGSVHIVLEDRGASDDIRYLQSADGGATFAAAVTFSNSDEPSLHPRIAASGARVAVTWQEMSDVLFVFSIDSGATFGEVLSLSNSPGTSADASVAIGTAIHVVWTEENAVAYRASLDGVVFAPAGLLGTAAEGHTIGGASVGSGVNTVHVSWNTMNADGARDGPFYRRSTDGGATFAAAQDLRFGGGGVPFGTPVVATGSSLARLAWPHSASGFAADSEILFVTESVCSVTWKNPVDGNWHDGTKWSNGFAPGLGSNVCITLNGNYTVKVIGVQRASFVTVGDADNTEQPRLLIESFGFAAGGSTSLSVTGQLVNVGTIELDEGPGSSGTAGAALAINGGTLVNTERGLLLADYTRDTGGGRSVQGSVLNRGTTTLNGRGMTLLTAGTSFTNFGTVTVTPTATLRFGGSYTFVQSGGMLDIDGTFVMGQDTFHFAGGDITGEVDLQALASLVIGANATRPATFVFSRGGNIPNGTTRIFGNVHEGQTIRIEASTGLGGSIGVTAAAGFTNAGTIVLTNAPPNNASAATLVVTAGTLVNTGTILVERGAGGGRRIDGHIENRGMFHARYDAGLFGTAGRTFTNLGTVLVEAGARMTFGTNFVFNQNDGVLRVDGGFELSTEFSSAGDTFNFNGGSVEGIVVISGHSRLNIGPGSEGPGTFHFERNVIFGISNGGHLSGNIASAQTVRVRGTPGGTALANVGTGFTNFGTLALEGTAANAGGATVALAAGTLVNRGTLHVGELGPGTALRGHLENRARMTVLKPLSLQLHGGTFHNFADLIIGAAGKVTLAAGFVVTQHQGRMTLDGPIELAQEFSTAPDVFNFNDGDISGAAGVHLFGTSVLNIGAAAADGEGVFVFRRAGNGQITGSLGAKMTLRIQGNNLTAANGLTSAGTIVLTTEPNHTTPVLNVAGKLVNTGTVAVDPIATVAPLNAVIENHGRMRIDDTITLQRANAAHFSDGVMEILAGRTLTLAGNSTFRNAAPGGIGGSGTLSIANGSTFTGVGALGINVINAGRFRPGASPGIVNITGAYTQTATGRLEVEIAGSNPGSGFDQVNVSNLATLAGTLDVRIAAGFCIEGAYPFLAYGAGVIGDFASRVGLAAAGGRSLVPNRGPNVYVLNASGPPCNAAPVANADAYSTEEGMPLVVAAPGVLVNDTDAQNNPLTAILAAGPANGMVTLNANGSFTYTPAPGFTGTDGFSYRASDGTDQSGLAGVTISVLAGTPPSITSLNPDALTVGHVRGVTILGARFSNPTVTLRRGDIEVPGNVLLSTPTTIHADFDLTSVPPGEWTVIVENPNGQSASAPILVDPAIVFPGFGWEGVRRFPIVPAPRLNRRSSYLTVFNVGLTDGMVLVTLELPHPAMRMKVGSPTGDLHTGGAVEVMVWAPRHRKVLVPIYLGISPEDIDFERIDIDIVPPQQPGELVGGAPLEEPGLILKPKFGQILSLKVHARMGLTAGSGQLGGLLFDVVAKSACGEIKDHFTGQDKTIFEHAIDAVIDKVKESTVGALEPKNLMKKVAEKMIEAFPLSKLAKAIAECEFELAKEFLESWEREIDDLSGELCEDEREVVRVQDLLARQGEAGNARGAISANRALLDWASNLDSEGDCDGPDHDEDLEGPIGAAFDPNDKTANSTLFCETAIVDGMVQCEPYFVGPDRVTEPIEYVVEFENLAEAPGPAENVVITDVLDDDLDPSTLRIVDTSHPNIPVTHPNRFSFDVVGNVATFRWTGVDLPPNQQAPEGEGYVMFTIEPKPGLADGTEIRNNASIVFDFNPPIVTPEVVHVIDAAPPVTTATRSAIPNAHGWNNTDVIVTLRGDDGAGGSGVKEIHARLEGAEQLVAGAAAMVRLAAEGVHTIAYFAVDHVGNVESERVLTVSIDKTAPSVDVARAPEANAHGWNNTDVTVTFAATDALSGIDGDDVVVQVFDAEGRDQGGSLTFVDRAGNETVAPIDGINIDKTAPTIDVTRAPEANAFGWNNTDVTATFTAVDLLSGIDGDAVTDVVFALEGADQGAERTFADRAGNHASATIDGINIDTTPPTITDSRAPEANGFGWNNTDVTASFACADALSGVHTCSVPTTLTADGAGQSVLGMAEDRAGNTATATVGGINIDKTPPLVACLPTPASIWPPNHRMVEVSAAVTVDDPLSGSAGFALTGAASNEPDEGVGDGAFPNDIQEFVAGTADTVGLLRAERAGRGNGRIYTLSYQGRDKADNTATCAALVAVPHDQSRR